MYRAIAAMEGVPARAGGQWRNAIVAQILTDAVR